MKDLLRANTLVLEMVEKDHPKRKEVEAYIGERYALAFDAKLNSFMPTFLALLEHDHIQSLCGFRIASNEALFLEQYLDEPAEVILSNVFSQAIGRESLIEFGQLASFSRGMSPVHFLLMTEKLVASGFEWCIFTATDPLYAMMCRLGLTPTILAEADPNRIADATKIWGNYYQHQPRIVAGNLKQGLAHLQSLFVNRSRTVIGE